jgi:hypothetical protein
VLLREDLEPWQRLNETAFLVGGLGSRLPEVTGEPYEDADGAAYLPMSHQPVLVFGGTKEFLTHGTQPGALSRVPPRALSRVLRRAVFTGDPFTTGHDEANRAAVRAVPRDQLDLIGLLVHGPRNAVGKRLKGARMHP